MPKAREAEGRARLVALVKALEAAAGDATAQLEAVHEAVLWFNTWNDQHAVIETGERETLNDELCRITYAAKLGDRTDEITDWRDW